jgi:ribonuclease Z
LLKADERLFLIDCAEGTQLQLRRFKIHFQRIKHIFISHLHGDHFYGLIGLLTSFHLLGRKDELHLYAHEELKDIIDIQLRASRTTLIYPVVFHTLTEAGQQVNGSTGQQGNGGTREQGTRNQRPVTSDQRPVTSDQRPVTSDQRPATSDQRQQATGNRELIFEDDALFVYAFPLLHSVPTCGFLFREKMQLRKIRKDVINKLQVPIEWMTRIKSGEDYLDDNGKVYSNNEMTQDPPAPRTYAYCSDTAYSEEIIPYIKGADLLYHEATFLSDMAATAREKLHSTAAEAATIANLAGVKKLIIGHFSARYDDPEALLTEAREIFPATELAEDGKVFNV